MIIRLSETMESMADNRGKNPPYYTNYGIPIIDTFLIGNSVYPNINNASRFIDSNLMNNFIRQQTRKDDMLVTLVGNGYGNVCLSLDNVAVIQNAVSIRFKKGFEPKFMYYYFSLPSIKAQVQNLDRGSAQPNIKVSDLMRIKINIPNLDTQNRIVDILSFYDKVIENNNKRIAILEQEAEEIYKEWFVRFRFPGYKAIEFKDIQIRGWTYGRSSVLKIPFNWEFGSFSMIGSFVRGKNITADKMISGDIPVISAGLEPSGYHNNSNVNGPSITISASGANAGYMSLHFSDIWAADCSYYQNKNWLWFAYSALKFLQHVITNMQIGAAQPHVYPKNIDRLFIVIPDNKILNDFNILVDPIFNEIKNLYQQNKLLGNQRDLLLPRLMSGKLEVK